MRWLAALLLVPLLATAQERRGVLVLGTGQPRETVLVEALRIYTRDLSRTVRVGGPPPATLDPDELARVAREAGDAEVVVWFGQRPVLYALRVATLDVRETPAEADDAARTLALKVRALLTARAEAWSVPSPSPSPSPSPEPSPEPPSPSPSPEPPSPSPEPNPPPPSSSLGVEHRTWVEATVVYGVMVPTNIDQVRHGLTLRVGMPFWRMTAFFDVAFQTAPSVTVDKSVVTTRVWPVGAGVQLRLVRPKWMISGGPRLSLQIIDADARATNGRTGSVRLYSAGIGIIAEAAWRFSRHVAALVSITMEALVQRQELAAGGMATTDLGWAQFGFNGGLLISIP